LLFDLVIIDLRLNYLQPTNLSIIFSLLAFINHYNQMHLVDHIEVQDQNQVKYLSSRHKLRNPQVQSVQVILVGYIALHY